MAELLKQELDVWLDAVSYKWLNSTAYVPTEFALIFMNFIKLVNGVEGESHETPPVHLKMLDKITEDETYIANLVFRGGAKTTIFMEYMTLFIAFYGYLPNFGLVESMIYVSDSMDNGVKSARKNIQFRYDSSPFLQHWVPYAFFTDNYLEFRSLEYVSSNGKQGSHLGVKMFGAKTGLRGTKIFGKRPPLAVLDDLISDDDSKSMVAMNAIKDTVYKGVNHALDPTRRKVIFNGTPFGKEDIMVEAVESGAWAVNVWPVCERFPCTREEFSGAWPDRFGFDYIQSQYDMAVKTGHLPGFDQELMLRLTSPEDRLIQDSEIKWFSRTQLNNNRGSFNFYVTTDIATSAKQRADFSVISVWAYNSKGDWFWVDGVCERQTIDKTWDDLFRLVSEYKPQLVGIEVNGQQQAYVKYLQSEMMSRNIWFSFASSEKSNEPGIRADMDKLRRLNLVVPWFAAGKMYFPEEMKHSVIIGQFLQQIRLATKNGLKGKDDCLDTISMLGYLKPWKPSETTPSVVEEEDDMWGNDTTEDDNNALNSYCP